MTTTFIILTFVAHADQRFILITASIIPLASLPGIGLNAVFPIRSVAVRFSFIPVLKIKSCVINPQERSGSSSSQT